MFGSFRANEKLSYDYEHIIIDNSSDDKTVQILRKLIEKDNKIKVIVNEKIMDI